MSFLNTLHNLQHALTMEYGDEQPVLRIQLSKRVFEQVQMGISELNRYHTQFRTGGFMEVLGVIILPEDQHEDSIAADDWYINPEPFKTERYGVITHVNVHEACSLPRAGWVRAVEVK